MGLEIERAAEEAKTESGFAHITSLFSESSAP